MLELDQFFYIFLLATSYYILFYKILFKQLIILVESIYALVKMAILIIKNQSVNKLYTMYNRHILPIFLKIMATVYIFIIQIS
jgi:hypothetical protein